MTAEPRRLLSTLVFAALFILSAALMAYIAWPFRIPLFLAAVLASVSSGLYTKLRVRLHNHPRRAAAVMTFALLAILVGPVLWIASFAVQQSLAGLAFVRDTMGVHSLTDFTQAQLPAGAAALLERIMAFTNITGEQIQGYFVGLEQNLREWVPQALGASSRVLFHGFILIFAFFFFLVEGPRLTLWLRGLSPLEKAQTEELASEFQRVLKATFAGLLVAAAVQGVLMTLAYIIAGVPFAFFFGLVTVFGLFVPIIGTALVWAPIGAGLILSGHLVAGIVLLVFCLIVSLLTENLIKPLVMRGSIEMHIGLIFISVLGGLTVFGLIGLVTGPLVATFFLAMMRIYQRDYLG